MNEEIKGIHKNLSSLILKTLKQIKQESFQKVADKENIDIDTLMFICHLTNNNSKRWKYIRWFKEGNSLEKIKEYNTNESIKEIAGIFSSLMRHANIFY